MLPNVALADGATRADALAAIAEYAPRAMSERGTPGLSVVVTDASQLTVTLGYADARPEGGVTPQASAWTPASARVDVVTG